MRFTYRSKIFFIRHRDSAKIVKYPEIFFDKTLQFPLELFQFPSIFEIRSMTDMQLISHYQ